VEYSGAIAVIAHSGVLVFVVIEYSRMLTLALSFVVIAYNYALFVIVCRYAVVVYTIHIVMRLRLLLVYIVM
jgi:hypothetical protein